MSGAPPRVDEADNAELKVLGIAILDRFSGNFPSLGSVRAIFSYRPLQPSTLSELGLLALLAALCGTGLVFVLNKEAALVQEREFALGLALLFIVILLAYRAFQKALNKRSMTGAAE